MGGAVGGLVSSVGSALIGKALGPKQKSANDVAAAAAASAPSQTAEQKEASQTLLPYLKDWMTNSPQLPFRTFTPTQVNVTGSTSSGARPGVTATPTFGGASIPAAPSGGSVGLGGKLGSALGGSVAGNSGQPTAQPTQQTQQAAQPAKKSNWGFTPGTWTEDRTVINNAKASLDSATAAYNNLQSQLAALNSQVMPTQQATQNMGKPGHSQNQARLAQMGAGGYGSNSGRIENLSVGPGGILYGYDQQGRMVNLTPPQAAQSDPNKAQRDSLQAQIDAARDQMNAAQASYDKALQAGPAKSFNPGTMTIEEVPTIDKLFGSLGAYQQGRNWDGLVGQTMNPVGESQFGYQQNMDPGTMNLLRRMSAPVNTQGGGYQSMNWSAIADQIGAPLQVGEQAGYRDATGQRYLPYNNNLEQTAESRIRSNLNRTVQEGYGADYLKELAAQGIDPLKEAYTDALNQASADYNRLGLRGSGFELGRKYGSQNDSITKGYLDAVRDVTRNVALTGAEAAREDRFRNAGLQDQALGMAQGLAGTQSDDQFRRLSGDLSQGQVDEGNRQWWTQFDQGTQLANKDLLSKAGNISMQQDQANEANRQGWWDRAQAASLANSGLAAQGLEALTGIRNQDELNRQYWNEDALKRRQLNNSNILQGVQQLSNLDQTDEANRQWWANTLEGQQRYDDANRIANWQANLDLLKWLANRDDEAAKLNLENQMTVDQKNILDTPQQGIANLLNFMNGQQGVANNQQQNYWSAFNAQNQANQNAAAQQAAIGNMFASAFQPTARAPVAPQPSAMQSFTNLLTNPISTLKSWF